MYDDDVQAPLGIGASDRYYKVARFPTRNIKTPIMLVYGGSDSLVDIHVMLKELPRHTVAQEIPHYEHLDFLWGSETATLVFPHVFEALGTFTKDVEYADSGIFSRAGYLANVDGAGHSDDDHSSTDPTSASVEGYSSAQYSTGQKSSRTGFHSRHKYPHKRSSNSSLRSTDSNAKIGGSGINIGSAKATTGMIDQASPPSSKGRGRHGNAKKP